MKAFGIQQLGSVEEIQELQLPKPEVTRPHDILIQVKAVSVNPVDCKMRKVGPDNATAIADAPRILGYDGAGVVSQIGSEVTRFKNGDHVYWAGDRLRPGSNAEFQLVDSRIVGFKPASISFPQAAALPLVTLTAWEGLFEGMAISRSGTLANASKTLLCIGGAGGVGSLVIQLAKLAGLVVIATASRPETTEYVRKLGADHVISHAQPLAPQLSALNIPNVNYIYNTSDTVLYFDQAAKLLSPLGKLVAINGTTTPLNVGLLMPTRSQLIWEYMFSRPTYGVDLEEQGKILDEAAKLIDNKTLSLPQLETLPLTLENLRKAHELIQSGKTIGKITLEFLD